MQERQNRNQEQQVGGEREYGEDAEQTVVHHHKGSHNQEAPQRGVEAFLDVFLTHRRADGALFDDFHRRGQRAGTQQECGVIGFGHVHAT